MSKEAKASSETGMTIPQLRKAFEHIDRWTSSHSGDVEGFRAEWKKTFGKEVGKQAAQDYLTFVKSAKGKKGSQKGGGTLSPAPLGYDMRAGADLPYGSFPEYVSGGFGFANMDSLKLDCAKDQTPRLPADLGSNKVGGGSKKAHRKSRKSTKTQGGGGIGTALTEFLTRPFGMNSPPSAAQDLQTIARGSPESLASPRPEINPLPFTQKPVIYNASIAKTSSQY